MRAVVAVALLVGVYVLALAVVAGVVVVGWLWLVAGRPFMFMWWTGLGLALIFVTISALVTFTRSRDREPYGVEVTPRDQPELWALVRRLAAVTPDEIYLVPDAEVRMTQRTRLMGLVTGVRRLYVGAPLLACMTERQIGFVLAHELGVHGNRDTRLVGLALAGRSALELTVHDLSHGHRYDQVIGAIFQQYAKLYLKVTDQLARWQVTASDANATKVTGSQAAESALREQAVVAAAWKLFHDKHFRPAWEAGYRPTTIFDAFARLRAAPELRAHLEDIRSHPTAETAARIAAVTALGVQTTGPDRPAGALLADGGAVMDRTLVSDLVEEFGLKQRVDWTQLGTISARAHRVEQTRRIVRIGGGSLTAVLDTIDNGGLDSLLRKDLKPGNPFGGLRVRREYAKGFLINELTLLAEVALVDAGRAVWETDWLGTTTFHGPDLSAEIELATDDRGSTAELRDALTARERAGA